jgi:spermidine synthase
MYLLRLMSLAHQPLPTTFATTLCLFLLFWSTGVFLASRLRARLRFTLCVASALTALMPTVYHYDRFVVGFSLYWGGLLYFLPCICFGLLFGILVSRSARSWGHDVGRFYFFNTLGSCLGILFFTLAGFEFEHDLNAFIIALGLLALFSFLIARRKGSSKAWRRAITVGQGAIAIGLGLVLLSGVTSPHSTGPGGLTYWGRDGVVEVREDGYVLIDGLRHTRLSNGRSHIGDPYTWLIAISAVLAHGDAPIRNALVVGNGIGITSSTLLKLPGVSVVAYEINHTLSNILTDSMKETLGLANNPRFELRWQDARSGLALDERRYDLIVSAPLYLRQAGSSLMLSREYMELIKSRLKDDGVFGLYAGEGIASQALLVHRTVRSVFPHVNVLYGGQIAVASQAPINMAERSIQDRLHRQGPLYQEISDFDTFMRKKKTSLYNFLQPRRLKLEPGALIITDNHPLVEYPSLVSRIMPLPSRDRAR